MLDVAADFKRVYSRGQTDKDAKTKSLELQEDFENIYDWIKYYRIPAEQSFTLEEERDFLLSTIDNFNWRLNELTDPGYYPNAEEEKEILQKQASLKVFFEELRAIEKKLAKVARE